MSKSRASKTKAAGLLVGQTRQNRVYGLPNKAVPQVMNRAMRRAKHENLSNDRT